jgi:hypothetical protein
MQETLSLLKFGQKKRIVNLGGVRVVGMKERLMYDLPNMQPRSSNNRGNFLPRSVGTRKGKNCRM